LAGLDSVEECSDYFKALCPAHNDHSPSLSVKEVDAENGQTKVLVKCWAGCDTTAVLEKLGLERKDLYPKRGPNGPKKSDHIVATYDYTSPTGELLHQTVRYEPKDEPEPEDPGDRYSPFQTCVTYN
jgi:hypothetical protein